MTIIRHENGQIAWTGYAAFHMNGNQAWTTEGIGYHENQEKAWTGFTAFDRERNQIFTNNDSFKLNIGSGFVIYHNGWKTDLIFKGDLLTSKQDYTGY